MKTQNIARLGIACGLALVIALAAFYVLNSSRDFSESPKTFNELGGDFTLESHLGETSLSDFKGDAVVLYFGYTHCEATCPTSLSIIGRAFKRLEESGINNTQGIMISLDPERDTLEDLKDFTEMFHERILGVMGGKQKTKQVGKQYGVYYDAGGDAEELAYSVDHASQFYVISPEGKLVTAMSPTTTPNELAAQIKEIL